MEIKEKLKHWFIMVSTNRCLGCCLFCEWWNMCKWETEEKEIMTMTEYCLMMKSKKEAENDKKRYS